jgi:hypothetical protein
MYWLDRENVDNPTKTCECVYIYITYRKKKEKKGDELLRQGQRWQPYWNQACVCGGGGGSSDTLTSFTHLYRGAKFSLRGRGDGALYIYIYLYMYTHTHTHTHIHMSVCVCVCVCVYVCMYIYIHMMMWHNTCMPDAPLYVWWCDAMYDDVT